MPHPYAFLCGVTQIAQMTQIFYFFTFKSSHTDLTDLRDFLPFKSSPGAMKLEASCPQAVPARKIWRGL